MRMIHDEEGQSWRVWHVVPQTRVALATTPELARGWLCFERQGEKRRLPNPPADWESLPDARLVEMLQTADQARVANA